MESNTSNDPISQEVVQTDVQKPKRQLTEAQRLAFIKGREKRLANLAKKREEKFELQKSKLETVAPERPKTPPPSTEAQAVAQVDQSSDLAERVADIVFNRISSTQVVHPQEKPKRKYVRRYQPDSPVKPSRKSPSPEPYVAPVPQKTYFWM